MPVEVTWLDEADHIILFKFVDRWTWDEFFTADGLAAEMAAQADAIADAIFDFSDAPVVPESALTSALNAARRSARSKNQGISVAIHVNRMLAVFLRAIETLAPGNVTGAENLEAALERIAQERARRAAKRDDELSV